MKKKAALYVTHTHIDILVNVFYLLAGIPNDDSKAWTVNFVDGFTLSFVADTSWCGEAATEGHEGNESNHQEASHLIEGSTVVLKGRRHILKVNET